MHRPGVNLANSEIKYPEKESLLFNIGSDVLEFYVSGQSVEDIDLLLISFKV